VADLRAARFGGAVFDENPFDQGPIRVEFSDFEKVELTPLDAYLGYDWAAQTTVATRGSWPMPLGWRVQSTGEFADKLQLDYRVGGNWRQCQPPH
jgi:hypothetical protein